MNRRGFLSSILAAGIAPAIVRASSLMKVSGIVVPEDYVIGYEYTGRLLTPSIITRESLRILEQNLLSANWMNRKFEQQFVSISSTLTIRSPK